MSDQARQVYAAVVPLINSGVPVADALTRVSTSLGLSPSAAGMSYYGERRERLKRGEPVPATRRYRPATDPATSDGQALIFEQFDSVLSWFDDVGDYDEANDLAWRELARSLHIDYTSTKRAFFAEQNRRRSLTPHQMKGLTALGFDLDRPIFHIADDEAQEIPDPTSGYRFVTTHDGFIFHLTIRHRRVVTPRIPAPDQTTTTTPPTPAALLVTGDLDSVGRLLESSELSTRFDKSSRPAVRIYWQSSPIVALLQPTPDLPAALAPLARLEISGRLSLK